MRLRSVFSVILAAAWAVAFVPAQDVPAVASRVAAGMDARAALPLSCWMHVEGAAMTAAVSFTAEFDALQARHAAREGVRHLDPDQAGGDLDEVAAVARIRAHLDENKIALELLARAVDVRGGVLESLFRTPDVIPAKYRVALIRAALEWCEADAAQRARRQARTVHTSCTRLIGGLARVCRETKVIGLAAGGTGFGKSTGAEIAAGELAGTILVRADTDSRGAKGLLRAIGEAASARLANDVAPSVKRGVEIVKRCGGLIIVDESHLVGPNGLEALRAIFDAAGVGVLLLGTTSLQRSLSPAVDPLVAPLWSRCAVRIDVDAELTGGNGRPRQWIDSATLAEILRRHNATEVDSEALSVLLRIANQHGAHLRAAVDTHRVAAVVARARCKGEAVSVTGADVDKALSWRRDDADQL